MKPRAWDSCPSKGHDLGGFPSLLSAGRGAARRRPRAALQQGRTRAPPCRGGRQGREQRVFRLPVQRSPSPRLDSRRWLRKADVKPLVELRLWTQSGLCCQRGGRRSLSCSPELPYSIGSTPSLPSAAAEVTHRITGSEQRSKRALSLQDLEVSRCDGRRCSCNGPLTQFKSKVAALFQGHTN